MATISRIPSPSSVFSAYASLSASVMLFQTAINQLIPRAVQNYISSAIRYYFKGKSSDLVLLIEESDGISSNEIYTAAETYLYSKIDSSIECLKICKWPNETGINVKFAQCEKIVDFYDGVEVVWRFSCEERKRGSSKHLAEDDSGNVFPEFEKRYFEMSFNKKNKDRVLNSYIPYILQKSKNMKDEKKVVKLHTLSTFSYSSSFLWESINLEHPSTFDTLAMDTELKKAIMEDMDRFVRRKDFYRKVGKAWKRGYLLHGPPGTGKSSLIAAMANYLKFDIYDLELANIKKDSDLRKLLLKTSNRSILVIEDIDCSVELPDRNGNSRIAEGRHNREYQVLCSFLFFFTFPSKCRSPFPVGIHSWNLQCYWRFSFVPSFVNYKKNPENGMAKNSTSPSVGFTLSGLLNFIDGLWSSCGDERIIIFTTNNKDRLDPALLRPGRMDMHIEMSYLTQDGFRTLATNYLNINNPHWRFGEIEELIGSMNVTPAEVAEELMKSDDPDVSLGGLSQFLNLKRKKMEDEDDGINADDGSREEEGHGIDQSQKGKRLKLDNGKDELLKKLQWFLDDPALVRP